MTLHFCVTTLDPCKPKLTALPREERDLAIKAEHHHVCGFDNASKVSPEMADALCRLSTGAGLEKRTNYSDRDLTSFDARRPWAITAIDEVTDRADFIDRALFAELVKPSSRRDEEELKREFAELHPKLLGALLVAYAEGLKGLNQVKLATQPRLIALARLAVAAAHVFELTQQDVEAAFQRSEDRQTSLAAEDEFVGALLEFAKETNSDKENPWTGELNSLRKAIEAFQRRQTGQEDWTPPKQGWPRSAKGVSSKLRGFEAEIERCGLKIDLSAKDPNPTIRRRLVSFWLVPKDSKPSPKNSKHWRSPRRRQPFRPNFPI
jgi:hypothetical protein